jgi:hypothetical protein
VKSSPFSQTLSGKRIATGWYSEETVYRRRRRNTLTCRSSQAKEQRDIMAHMFIVLLYPFLIWITYY